MHCEINVIRVSYDHSYTSPTMLGYVRLASHSPEIQFWQQRLRSSKEVRNFPLCVSFFLSKTGVCWGFWIGKMEIHRLMWVLAFHFSLHELVTSSYHFGNSISPLFFSVSLKPLPCLLLGICVNFCSDKMVIVILVVYLIVEFLSQEE